MRKFSASPVISMSCLLCSLCWVIHLSQTCMRTEIRSSGKKTSLSWCHAGGRIAPSLMIRTPSCFQPKPIMPCFSEVRDHQYHLIDDYRPIVNQKYQQMLEVFDGFRQFNKYLAVILKRRTILGKARAASGHTGSRVVRLAPGIFPATGAQEFY